MRSLCYIFYTIVIVLLLTYLYIKLKQKKINKLMKNVKTIKSELPFIGNAHRIIGKSHEELFQIFDNFFRTECTDEPVKAWLGPYCFLFLNNPNDIKTILASPHALEKHSIFQYVTVQNGLSTAPLEQWRTLRAILTPFFSLATIKSQISAMNECAIKMCYQMENDFGPKFDRVDGVEFDCRNSMLKVFLLMANETMLGLKLDLGLYDDNVFLEKQLCTIDLMAMVMSKFWIQPNWIYKFSKNHTDLMDLITNVNRRTSRVIKQFQENDYSFMDAEDKPLIAHLTELNKTGGIEENMIQELLNNLIFTCAENSGLTTAYILLMLAMNQDVQNRVHNEIVQIVPTQSNISYEDLDKMLYLDAVINETLRLYPAVSNISRTTTSDIELENFTIPANISIFISIYHLHRDQRIWGREAEQFNPDKFNPETTDESFIPFSAGPRNCIASKLATIQVKICLVHFLRQFHVTTKLRNIGELQFVHSTTLKLANRHLISIQRR